VDACRSFAQTRVRCDRFDWPRPEPPARPTASRKYEFLSAPPGGETLQVGKVWFPDGPPCRSRRKTSNFRAHIERLGQLICPSGCPANFVSSPLCKNISVFTPPKSLLELFVSHPTEGRIMIVTDAGWDAVDAAASCARWDRRAGSSGLVSDHRHADERRFSRTAKSCGPDAPTLASSFAEFCRPNRAMTKRYPRGDGGKRARSPGRARHKPLKPLRAGMPGDSGVLVVTRVRSTNTKCTRGRGCNGHPAFPTPSLGAEDSSTTRAHRAARSRCRI
jgi:hypothetical protein